MSTVYKPTSHSLTQFGKLHGYTITVHTFTVYSLTQFRRLPVYATYLILLDTISKSSCIGHVFHTLGHNFEVFVSTPHISYSWTQFRSLSVHATYFILVDTISKTFCPRHIVKHFQPEHRFVFAGVYVVVSAPFSLFSCAPFLKC